MTLPDPKFAPRRGDLPWLRRRRRRPAVATTTTTRPTATATPTRPAATTSPTPTRGPVTGTGSSGGRIDYTKHRPTEAPVTTPAPAPRSAPTPPRAPTRAPSPPPTPRRDPAPAAASNSLDLSGPAPTPTPAPRRDPTPTAGGSTSLDLGGPPPSPAPTPAPASSSTSLDLGGAPPPPAPAPTSSTSLDLGGGGGPAPSPGPRPARRPTPNPTPDRHHVVRRTRRGTATLLDFAAPVVTLDRIQAGVGALTLDAVVGDEVGDLRIGAAWALTDGRSGTVELDAERRHGPDTRRPVVWAGREGRFERISLDLRQSRSLARLLVYGFSPTKQTVRWGGTVVVTTFGGDRVDAAIVSAPSPAVMALVSVYNVDGEFVVRSEMDPVAGSVRDTCRAFGYDRITWLDDRTPVA